MQKCLLKGCLLKMCVLRESVICEFKIINHLSQGHFRNVIKNERQNKNKIHIFWKYVNLCSLWEIQHRATKPYSTSQLHRLPRPLVLLPLRYPPRSPILHFNLQRSDSQFLCFLFVTQQVFVCSLLSRKLLPYNFP